MFQRCVSIGWVLLLGTSAWAQNAPAPEIKSTLTVEAAATAKPAESPKPDGELKANVGFGAILNSGNSESQTFSGNGLTSYKWDRNKVEGTLVGAYGKATNAGVSQVNTKNWKTTLRYDRYLSDPLSLFALGHLGQDRPAGFSSRYGAAAGLAHEIWKVDPNFFKYEIGADYTKENRVAPPNRDTYSARVFLQYKLKLSTYANFGQDVESLFDLQRSENVRINTLTSLTAKLTDRVSFQIGFGVKFNNDPPTGFKKTDTTTQAGLVVTLL